MHDYDTLVLSGGGTKGIIMLGSLQYALDNNYLSNIKNYIGTSVGSIICYLLAIGYTPIECIIFLCTHKLIEKMQHFNLVAMINGDGATNYNHIQESLEKMTIEKIGRYLNLKELYEKFDKKLVCTTYNQTDKKTEYISVDTYPEMPCLVAIRLSSNVPFLFNKFKYMGNYYVDGGISDNFSILHAQEISKTKVLGIRIIKDEEIIGKENSILREFFHFLYVPINQSTEYKISLCDKEKCKIISLNNTGTFAFDFNIKSKEKLEMFSFGYNQIKQVFEEEDNTIT